MTRSGRGVIRRLRARLRGVVAELPMLRVGLLFREVLRAHHMILSGEGDVLQSSVHLGGIATENMILCEVGMPRPSLLCADQPRRSGRNGVPRAVSRRTARALRCIWRIEKSEQNRREKVCSHPFPFSSTDRSCSRHCWPRSPLEALPSHNFTAPVHSRRSTTLLVPDTSQHETLHSSS